MRSVRQAGLWIAASGMVGAALFWGCSSRPGVLFEAADQQRVWPPPPDEPRVRYVGQLRSSEDLRAGRSGLEGFGEAIFGREPVPGLLSPLAVCTDGGERVFVADSNAQLVHAFDLKTRRYERWTPKRKGESGLRFSQPVALAWDPQGRLLVSDAVEGIIFVFDPRGVFLGTFGEGIVSRPCGLAVDGATGATYVADVGSHQIVVLGRDGEESARIGERGSGPGQFNYPTNVALGKEGRLYVSDSLNFRVQVFGADHRFLHQIGSKGDLPGYFSQPKGIAVDKDENLFVVDANFEAVQIFDAEGRLLMSFGQEGHGAGEFWLPAGIHVDAIGRVWVADSYNRRVQIFERIQTEAMP